jgi:transcriptional regulator with XRE-family HTH domain
MTFSEKLREIRLASGVSQGELAAASGVERLSISQIETGRRRWPRFDTIRRLCVALDVPLSVFEDCLPKKRNRKKQ